MRSFGNEIARLQIAVEPPTLPAPHLTKWATRPPIKKPNRPAKTSRPDTPFNPISLHGRHDGWTAERQTDFIDALAETGCVTDAARRVGLSRHSAYRLRADPAAGSFRLAWDNALEFAMLQLQDAVMSRAINGVVIPHYYQGKKVGGHRRYDDRLAQFLLRTRRPAIYGRNAEQVQTGAPAEYYAIALDDAVQRMRPGEPTPSENRGGPIWAQGRALYSLIKPSLHNHPSETPEEREAAYLKYKEKLDGMKRRLFVVPFPEGLLPDRMASLLSPSGDVARVDEDPTDTNS